MGAGTAGELPQPGTMATRPILTVDTFGGGGPGGGGGGGGGGWVEDKDNSYPWKWQIGKKPKNTAERTASKYRYAAVSPDLPCLVL